MIIQKFLQQIHNTKGQTEQQSSTNQVIKSDLINSNFWDALIAPVLGICFFIQQTVNLLLPFIYQVDQYFVN